MANLPGVDGKEHSLKEFTRQKILMVLFTSNHCPTSHSIEFRLKSLVKGMEGKSFRLVAINPNNREGMTPQEFGYGKYTDSFADMLPYYKDVGWDFPYLYDGEKQSTAKAYGCLATPHVFLFDHERKLRYTGRFDDSRLLDDSIKSSAAVVWSWTCTGPQLVC